jgi:hypothetical protein
LCAHHVLFSVVHDLQNMHHGCAVKNECHLFSDKVFPALAGIVGQRSWFSPHSTDKVNLALTRRWLCEADRWPMAARQERGAARGHLAGDGGL